MTRLFSARRVQALYVFSRPSEEWLGKTRICGLPVEVVVTRSYVDLFWHLASYHKYTFRVREDGRAMEIETVIPRMKRFLRAMAKEV